MIIKIYGSKVLSTKITDEITNSIKLKKYKLIK